MRNSDTVLCILSEKAKEKEYTFERLYRNLYNPDFYLKAIGKTYSNAGAGTEGSDGTSIDGTSMKDIETIISLMKNEKYQPVPLERIYVDKKGSNKKRPLGIPAYKDKLVQEVLRLILETIYEPVFSKYSHGFRKDKSCHTALKQIKDTFTGINWFIEGDIKGCFDNIDHSILVNIIRKKIHDEKLIRLIYKFLKCGYIEDWKFHKTYSGTPQGGIISPLLANIYLNELDMFIEKLKEEFDIGHRSKNRKVNKEWARITHQMNKLKKEIENNPSEENKKKLKELRLERANQTYWEPMSSEFKRIQYVRYADDFIIGVIGSKEDSIYIKNRISEFIKERLNMELSDEKTLITNSKNRAKFLGYEITKSSSKSLSKDKNGVLKKNHSGVINLYMPKNTIRNWLAKNKIVKDIDSKEWRMNHRPSLLILTDLEIIEIYNSEIRGLYNYYKMSNNVHTHISTLIYAMEYSCLGTLANKYKASRGKIRNKYRNEKGWGVSYETKEGSKFRFFYNDPITKITNPFPQDKVDDQFNLMTIKGTRTQLEDRLKANKCELCNYDKNDRRYEVHHVNKMKNFKGKESWEIEMIARKRKTLIVCDKCHREIHQGIR